MISLNAQMENKLLRLATFKNLPESADLFPSIVSKAGFYYTGEGHTVACYSCGLRLNHWESGIHPMTLHKRLSPECQFVVSQPTDDGSAAQDDTEVVSAEEVMSQSELTRTGRHFPQVSQGHNNQRRRRHGYNSMHNYYAQLASVAGSLHSSTGASTERTQYGPSPFSLTHSYTNVDRFTCRRMRDRINNNDPTLMEEMKYENQRLSSYANWPQNTNIQPEALAQAGLFYLCRADRVKCAFCSGILRNWGASEEPMRKHRQLFPRCPFVLDPRAAGNVAIGEEPTEEQLLNVTTNTANSSGTGELGIETARPRHPAMAVEAVRLASFDRWPRSSPVTPENLARAGFYYTGASSGVCCFFCDGRVSSLPHNVDPMTEHRRLFPQCGFVRMTRDNDQTSTGQSTHQSASTTTSAGAVATTDATGQSNAGDAPAQNPALTCTVCLDAQKTILFLPCGHLACCANCASALTTCPICRTEIRGSVRTYLA